MTHSDTKNKLPKSSPPKDRRGNSNNGKKKNSQRTTSGSPWDAFCQLMEESETVHI